MMRKERINHSKGYQLLYRPNHPTADHHGYVPEQRLAMEEVIKRYINPLLEDVHHKDNSIQNNNIKNLELLTKAEHRRLHSGWRLVDGEWWKTCTGCARFLKVRGNFYMRRNGHNEYVSRCKVCSIKEVLQRVRRQKD